MTDNEMAEKYASENKQIYGSDEYGYITDYNNIKEAYLAGLEARKPQWHKVADGDLPKETGDYITNIGVLTYDSYGDGVFKWHTPFCEACDYSNVVGDDEVIAWCEIPKYTDEESK